MKWYAQKLGYGEDATYWGIVGLLHDIDFERYPNEHCVKAVELLQQANVPESIIHAVCSHGYGLCSDVEPVHDIEEGTQCENQSAAGEISKYLFLGNDLYVTDTLNVIELKDLDMGVLSRISELLKI